MRHWLFHPLIFYPLIILIAGLAIVASMEPQNWPRTPAPVAAQRAGHSLIWAGEGFNSPQLAPEQRLTIERDLMGRAKDIHLAVLPDLGAARADETGLQLLLTPEDAAMLRNRRVTVQISYQPLPVNAASGLAVSLQGGRTSIWVTKDAPSPPQGTLNYELPPQATPTAIALRVISTTSGEAYGLEITKVQLTPHS